jgi:uncharacterized protein YecE (DUF72 family)
MSAETAHPAPDATPKQPATPYIGTSGWSYTIWKPDFYPKNVASKNFLNYYATQLNAVEVNFTFRMRLQEKTALGWMAAVNPNFRFALKANQFITHIRRLNNCEEPLQRFLTSLQPFGNQLGPVLFQLPPNLKCDVGLLRNFLALFPKNFRSAFEFRHESWFTEDVYSALREGHAALCISETEKLTTPEVHTAGYTYFRLREVSYSAEDLQQIAGRIERVLNDGREAYVFFKHEEDPKSALDAVALLQAFPERTDLA